MIEKEIFNPDQPWSTWSEKQDYKIETRVSERDLLVVHSNAIINESIDNIIEAIADYSERASWD